MPDDVTGTSPRGDDTPRAGRPRSVRAAPNSPSRILLAIGIPLCAVLAGVEVSVITRALTDCDAGVGGPAGNFVAVVVYFPAMALSGWAAWAGAIATVGRTSRVLGVVIGTVLAAVVSWMVFVWFLAPPADYSTDFCTGWTPAWWPSWLPR